MFNINVPCLFLIVSLLVFNVRAHPANKTNYELTADYFEGDMIFNPDMQREFEDEINARREKRHAISDGINRWPNRIVSYDISPQFSTQERNLIFQAMHHISQHTCIRFHQRHQGLRNYVFIRPDPNGCSATVGYWGRGVTYVNLRRMDSRSPGCFTQGIIVHEVLHTLGIFHQQSATNRDNFVRIQRQNIINGQQHNFDRLPNSQATSFGVGYDFSSIMHYDTHAFSRNGQPTIVPIRQVDARMIGQRRGLSSLDIEKIRRMYQC